MLIELDDSRIDLVAGQVHRDGGVQALSREEALVLLHLVERAQTPVGAESLAESCGLTQRALKGVISRVRRKVGATLILTVRGQGWMYVGPAAVAQTTQRLVPLPGDSHFDIAQSLVLLPNGKDVGITRLERGLLVYLLARRGQAVPRLQLLREVWRLPHSANIRAVDNTVYRLRKKLGPGIVQSNAMGLTVGSPPSETNWWVAALADEPSSAEEVVAAGAVMVEFSPPAVAFDAEESLRRWMAQHQHRAMGIAWGPLRSRASGWAGTPLEIARQLVLVAQPGQQLVGKAVSWAGFEKVGDRLVGAERIILFKTKHTPDPDLSDPCFVNIPETVPWFCGRSQEVAAVHQAMDAQVRLVTLTGMGGAGKTAIAQQVARELGQMSVVFCNLWGVATTQAAHANLGAALGCGANQAAIAQRLVSVGPVLLVLDGLAGKLAEALAVLLDVAGLQILATSRMPLGLPGEHLVPVGPLPPEDATPLFLERARAFGAHPTEEQATRVVEQLDGWPLAIEFVAARARLGLQALTASPQRMGLQAVFEWSWERTEHGDQLARLCVFETGFDLDDVMALLDHPDPISAIDGWMQAGWLHNAEGPLPLRLLAPVREFLSQKLVDVDAAKMRQLQHFHQHLKTIGIFSLYFRSKPPAVRARYGELPSLSAFALVHAPELLPELLMLQVTQNVIRVHDLAEKARQKVPADGWLTYLWERSGRGAEHILESLQEQAVQAGDLHLAMSVWYRRVQHHAGRGDSDGIQALLDHAQVTNDDDGRYLICHVRYQMHFARGELREALNVMAPIQRLAEATDHHHHRVAIMATLHQNLGDLEDAEAGFRELTHRVHTWNQTFVLIHRQLAEVWHLLGRHEDAMQKLVWLEEHWQVEDDSRALILSHLAQASLGADPHAAADRCRQAQAMVPRLDPVLALVVKGLAVPVAIANNDRPWVSRLVDDLMESTMARSLFGSWLASCALGLAWLEDPRAQRLLVEAKQQAAAIGLTPQAAVSRTLQHAQALVLSKAE